MSKVTVKDETKEQRFKRIAGGRTLRILDDLRLLGNCAKKGTYSYSEEDVKKIFSAIEKETRNVKSLFSRGKVKFELK
jgi:hypothetical protein